MVSWATQAVGDAVNVASRLEELNRDLGTSLAVSDACITDAGFLPPRSARFHDQVEVHVRGRTQPLLMHVVR